MQTITATALPVPARPVRPVVTVVPPSRARARLPELPGAPLVGPALVVAASILLAAGTAGLFF